MRKIGQGWQYTVYDMDNGRVRKQTYSPVLQYLYILKNNIFNWSIFSEAKKGMHRVRKMEKASNDYIQSILPRLDSGLLGHPTFFTDGYEQDKSIILGDILKKCSLSEGKEIFDSYIELIYNTWRYGFADTVFNFAVNNSLNMDHNVIQIDFGELIFDKSEIEQNIKNKSWLRSASYTMFPEGELKSYYRNLMERKLTLEKLNKLWKSKLKAHRNSKTTGARQLNLAE